MRSRRWVESDPNDPRTGKWEYYEIPDEPYTLPEEAFAWGVWLFFIACWSAGFIVAAISYFSKG